MAIELSDSIRIGQMRPVDDRYLNGLTPYGSITEAKALVPKEQRYAGLTINIGGVEYWWSPQETDLAGDPVIKTVDLSGYQSLSAKGQVNGYAGLDAGGKVPVAQLPDAVLGALQFQGQWNAETNTPAIPGASAANKGWFYITQTAGVYNGVSYHVGDWILSNGSTWERIANSDTVMSVFGRIGEVVANEGDYGAYYPKLSESYNNPSWINQLAWGKITGLPLTLSGYGIGGNDPLLVGKANLNGGNTFSGIQNFQGSDFLNVRGNTARGGGGTRIFDSNNNYIGDIQLAYGPTYSGFKVSRNISNPPDSTISSVPLLDIHYETFHAKFHGTVEGVSPVESNDFTTKNYVDVLAAEKANLNGGNLFTGGMQKIDGGSIGVDALGILGQVNAYGYRFFFAERANDILNSSSYCDFAIKPQIVKPNKLVFLTSNNPMGDSYDATWDKTSGVFDFRVNPTVNGVPFVSLTDLNNKANKDGSNAIGTWGIDISGTSYKANRLSYGPYNDLIISSAGGDDISLEVQGGGVVNIPRGEVYRAESAETATYWGGLASNYNSGVQGGGITSLLGVHGNGYAYGFNKNGVQSWLELGSSAYKNANTLSDWNGGNVQSAPDNTDLFSHSALGTGFYDQYNFLNNPTDGNWVRVLRIRHGNSNGYFSQLAFDFHHNRIWLQTQANGDNLGGWKRLLTQDDINVGGETLQSVTDRRNETNNTLFITGYSRPTGNPVGKAMMFDYHPNDLGAIMAYDYSTNTYKNIAINGNPESANVGIGTYFPMAKLHVNGSVNIDGALNVGAPSTAPGNKYIELSNNFIQANESGFGPTSLIFQKYGGNVGIGSNSPERRLHVQGNAVVAMDNASPGNWGDSQFEIRGTYPSIGFHYPGTYGAALYMNNAGTLIWNGSGLSVNGQVSAALPTADGHVATKKYVDNLASGKANIFGQTFTGEIKGPDGTTATSYVTRQQIPSLVAQGSGVVRLLDAPSSALFNPNYANNEFLSIGFAGTDYSISVPAGTFTSGKWMLSAKVCIDHVQKTNSSNQVVQNYLSFVQGSNMFSIPLYINNNYGTVSGRTQYQTSDVTMVSRTSGVVYYNTNSILTQLGLFNTSAGHYDLYRSNGSNSDIDWNAAFTIKIYSVRTNRNNIEFSVIPMTVEIADL